MTCKIVHVAAAVIYRPDGAVLLGQRAPGTFYPGYWEFPGGKVEACETPREALVRELDEELGIQVLTAHPWLRIEHEYEHAHVCLHFFKVTAWRGELRDHVHTALEWQTPDAFTVGPMLPANGPILKSLGLPDFYAITQAAGRGVEQQLARLAVALERGLRLLQIREPDLDAKTRSDFAQAAVALCHRFGARVLVNDDEALARSCGADGLHLPARRLMSLAQRPDFPWVAASCHNRDELVKAETLGLDFAVLGPVQTTASHPGQAALGWEACADLLPRGLPVYALGGLGRADLATAWSKGAHGVAAIRSAWAD
ncbi:MAG: Nudix family hydrolase [Rhodocyclaceae bacterium]|nr:MAG: Nudix family hydrolase [Rhodocyclaceae bacterium]